MSQLHLDREINVPGDFHAGLAAMRPELLRRIDRPLTQEEGHAVADAMATLVSTLLKTQIRAERAEARLGGMAEDLTRLKAVLQDTALEVGSLREQTMTPEPLPGDDDDGQ